MPQGQRPPALGYYDKNRQTVLIWNEAPNDTNTLAHELGHHYTGGEEWSSKFVDFGYELFSRLFKEIKA
jgi:Zn-dependent peptidase ImmA (M78 family)